MCAYTCVCLYSRVCLHVSVYVHECVCVCVCVCVSAFARMHLFPATIALSTPRIISKDFIYKINSVFVVKTFWQDKPLRGQSTYLYSCSGEAFETIQNFTLLYNLWGPGGEEEERNKIWRLRKRRIMNMTSGKEQRGSKGVDWNYCWSRINLIKIS